MVRGFLPFLLLALFVFCLQLSFYAVSQKGSLTDADCYMRLVRVEEFHRTGDWYNNVIPRSNAPYGETLHWTRPLDVVLIVGAVVLQPFLGFKQALLTWGIVLSPLLQIAALLSLMWAACFFQNQHEKFRLGILFFLFPAVCIPFLAGRPDHHSLLVLLFILEMGCLFRAAQNHRPFAVILGCLLAVSMWISVESIASVAACFIALGSVWLLDEKNDGRVLSHAALALFLGSLIALAADKLPMDWLRVELDRISIVHIFIFGLMAALAWPCRRLQRKKNRLLYALTASSILFALMAIAFPCFFHGPYTQMEPEAKKLWLKGVKEVLPLLSFDRKGESLAQFLIWLGPALIVIPFVAWRFFQAVTLNSKNQFTHNCEARFPAAPAAKTGGCFASLARNDNEGQETRWMICCTSGLLIFLPLSLYQIRWVYYAGIVLLFPYAAVLNFVIAKLEMRFRQPALSVLRASSIVFFAAFFLVLGFVLMPEAKTQDSTPKKQEGNFPEVCSFLKREKKVQRIATFIDLGPKILHSTLHEVIATPYHRNGRGIRDVHALMTAKTDGEALKKVRQREITLILLWPSSNESSFYEKSGDSFYKRLLRGKMPKWLLKRNLPSNLTDTFMLFEVI